MDRSRTLGGATLVLALVASAAAPRAAFAQGEPLAMRLLERMGANIDLRSDPELKKELVDRGLIPRSASSVRVDPQLVERVVGNDRFLNETRGIRYRTGDRVFVNTNGNLNVRGEIEGINADGTYRVRTWDRVESVNPPNIGDAVDPFTGRSRRGTPPTTIRRPGATTTETVDDPWLIRHNERTVTITHDEIDRLNGVVDPGEGGREYSVNGYVVNLEHDAVLKERVDAAMKAIDGLIASGRLDLTLPSDPDARAKKIAEITEFQVRLVMEIFKSNPMGYLRGTDAQRRWDRMHSDPEMRLGGRLMVGGVLKYAVGVCSDQTAALAAVMREVGRRVGFDVRVIHGATIDGGGHNFMTFRLANGYRFIMDPSWHSQVDTPYAALENIDFATFDTRWWSNREINSFGEDVSRRIDFTAPGSPERAALERAYNDGVVERLLAGEAAERMRNRPGANAREVAREVVRDRVGDGADRLPYTGDVTRLPDLVGTHLDRLVASGATRTVRGLIDRIDNTRLRDRTTRNRDRTRRGAP